MKKNMQTSRVCQLCLEQQITRRKQNTQTSHVCQLASSVGTTNHKNGCYLWQLLFITFFLKISKIKVIYKQVHTFKQRKHILQQLYKCIEIWYSLVIVSNIAYEEKYSGLSCLSTSCVRNKRSQECILCMATLVYNILCLYYQEKIACRQLHNFKPW